MSDDTSDLTVTLKAGGGYDAPWIVVRGTTPEEVAFKLKNIDSVIEATHEAAGLFAAGRLGTQQQSEAPTPPPTDQPKQQAWGQQSSAPAQQAPRSKFGGQLHPEGKTCEICPNVLELKKTTTGKAKWQCNDWRWNNGNPNGHSSEFID